MNTTWDRIMVQKSRVLFVVLLFGLCSGCGTILGHRLESDPRYGAVLYAEQLKNEGNLPGITANEHGEMLLDDAGGIITHTGIQYPLEVIVRARKSGDTEKAVYVYRMLKDTAHATWRLVGACKRVNGRNVWYKDLSH